MKLEKSHKPSFHPFSHPRQITGMIIGNDLDALLSAALLKHRFGWNVTGMYDFYRLWYPANFRESFFLNQLQKGKYIAVDLDIRRDYLPSVGHHILQLSTQDQPAGFSASLNPNMLCNITVQNYRRKYPLGTVQFLMWLLDEFPLMSRLGELLLWLADSTYINGQSHRFRENVRDWLQNFMPHRQLLHHFNEIDGKTFEMDIRDRAIPALLKTGIGLNTGRVQSRHLKLSGYQCRFDDPNAALPALKELFKLIETEIGWTAPALPKSFSNIHGKRRRYSLQKNEIEQKMFLSNFLKKHHVFSHALDFMNSINYTTFEYDF